MSDAFPKLCFKTTVDEQEVRVWGETDGVELSAGMWPNVVEMRVPVHEYAKLAGDFDRIGDLELYFSDPAAPDLTLVGWVLGDVRDALRGKPAGGDAHQVIAKTLVLQDRRWEFMSGRGGLSPFGLVNESSGDGTKVSNPPGSVFNKNRTEFSSPTGATAWMIVVALAGRLGYATGLERIGDDLIPAALDTEPMPRDVNLDGVHLPTAIQQVLDAHEAIWCLRPDGTYRIHMLTDGEVGELSDPLAPAAPARELPSDLTTMRQNVPAIVVVTSAPSRAVNRVGAVGPSPVGDVYWEFVGREMDGSLCRLEDLSYFKSSDCDDLAEWTRRGFTGVAAGAYMAAKASVWRILRLGGPDRHLYLPLLTQGVEELLDADGTPRALPGVLVNARVAERRADYRWYNNTDLVGLSGFGIDPVNGLLIFPRRLGSVTVDGAPGPGEYFEPLGAEDVEVEWHHEVMDQGDLRDFWAVGFERNASGQVVDKDVDDALSESGTDVQFIRMPELREYRVDGEVINGDSLAAVARPVAEKILSHEGQIRRRRFVGFHDVSPNGAIPTVRWRLSDGTTEIEERTYFIGRNRYAEKKTLFNLRAGAAAGADAHARASRETKLGARDAASPLPTVPGTMDPELPPRLVVSSGVATGGWDAASPNEITLNPCINAEGDHVDTAAEVLCDIYGSDQAEPTFVAIDEGDVLAYVSTGVDSEGNRTGQLVSPPLEGTSVTPEDLTVTAGSPTADTDTWDQDDPPADTDGVTVRIERSFYDSTAHKHRLAYRDLTFDSRGRLASVSAETLADATPMTECDDT